MRLLKLFCKLITIILVGMLEMCWSAILFLIDFIDGSDEPKRVPMGKVWFNYRTGEVNSVKQFNGIYDDDDMQDDNW